MINLEEKGLVGLNDQGAAGHVVPFIDGVLVPIRWCLSDRSAHRADMPLVGALARV